MILLHILWAVLTYQVATFWTGEHSHKCVCGKIWKHANRKQGNKAAHTCTDCGKEQWDRYIPEL